MIALTDHQLAIVMDAAAALAPERRSMFLERVGAMLKVRGRFTDADVSDVTRLALCGLIHTAKQCGVMWRCPGLRVCQGRVLRGPGRYQYAPPPCR